MTELQATIDVQVELGKFYNVDLFQRGYYQLHTSLKTPAKAPIKVEVSLPRNSDCGLVFPASIINGVAISKTFQILYRNEDIIIDDVILFKIHILIDSQKVLESLNNAGLELGVDLWFTDEEFGPRLMSRPEQQEKLQCISQRTLKLHFNPTKGIHHHVPVLFDYFHLSAVCITIHASLIALHQPYMNLTKLPKAAWNTKNEHATLETVLFGSRAQTKAQRFECARTAHRTICQILLCAYESLQTSLETLTAKLPEDTHSPIGHVNCHAKLETLTEVISTFTCEEDLLQTATTHIAQMCAENMLLWAQYTETVTLNNHVTVVLSKEHHLLRTKRFSEGFFTYEYPKQAMLACFEQSIHGHTELAAQIRSSEYFMQLQPLTVECLEMDGDYITLPVIFEDVYCEPTVAKDIAAELVSNHDVSRSSKHSDSSSNASSTTSPPAVRRHSKRKIIDIRPGTFKRPGSYIEDSSARGSVAVDQPACALVGYRKVNPEQPTNVTQLGTLSTEAEVELSESYAKNLMANAVSMPSLMNTTKINGELVNSGSMPELFKAEKLRDNSDEKLLETSSQNTPKVTFSDNLLQNKDRDIDTAVEPLQTDSVGDHKDNVNDNNDSIEPNSTENMGIATDRPSFDSVNINGLEDVESTGTETAVDNAGSDDTDVVSDTADASSEDAAACVSVSEKQGNNDGDGVKCSTESEVAALSDVTITISDTTDDNTSDCGSKEKADDVVDITERRTSVTSTDSTKASIVSVDSAKASSISSDSHKLRSQDNHHGSVSTVDQLADREDSAVLSMDAKDNVDTVNSAEKRVADEAQDISKAAESSASTPVDDHGNDAPKSTTILSNSISNNSSVSSSNSDTGSGSSKRMSINEWLKDEYEQSQKKKSSTPSSVNAISIIGAGCLSGMSPMGGVSKADVRTGGIGIKGLHNQKEERRSEREKSKPKLAAAAEASPDLSLYSKEKKLVPVVADSTISFITAKENLRQELKYNGHIYSDFPTQASTSPYFHLTDPPPRACEGIHLIVCVHGLDGNSADLRLVRTYLEIAMFGDRIDFLMSEKNQNDTFADFDVMTDRLVNEIFYHIDMYGLKPSRISFIGHSLGNLIIRSALSKPQMAPLLPKLYTFLSLSGPHLGTLYNNSGLVNMGMWVMQKWKKSGSLLQLSLKDHSDPRQSFLYKLSQKQGLEFFKNIILVGSSQDRYVPFHSSRIELCKSALKDTGGTGSVYAEMVSNILQPIVYNSDIKFVRYDVFHALNNTANNLIGRAAHIAVLDSELFIEKFVLVAILKYFK